MSGAHHGYVHVRPDGHGYVHAVRDRRCEYVYEYAGGYAHGCELMFRADVREYEYVRAHGYAAAQPYPLLSQPYWQS